jgi:hypothetical protein
MPTETPNSTWIKLAELANALHEALELKPAILKAGHFIEPGSILNAYREGDATFEEALNDLDTWCWNKHLEYQRGTDKEKGGKTPK